MELIHDIFIQTLGFLSTPIIPGVSFFWLILGIFVFCLLVRFF